MREFDHKESWAWKNWRFWTVVLEKTLESPLDCKDIKPVNPKGNQSWIFIGRIDAEAEGPTFWPPDVKNWLLGKDPDTGKDWRQKEQWMTEDEVVRWHHRLDEQELEWALAVDDGQGGLACCSPWGCKSQTWLSDWTDWPWSYTQSYYYFHCSKRMSLTWLSYLQGSLDFRRHESYKSQR